MIFNIYLVKKESWGKQKNLIKKVKDKALAMSGNPSMPRSVSVYTAECIEVDWRSKSTKYRTLCRRPETNSNRPLR